MLRYICKIMMRLRGDRIGFYAPLPKRIIVGVTHTSAWDFVWAWGWGMKFMAPGD